MSFILYHTTHHHYTAMPALIFPGHENENDLILETFCPCCDSYLVSIKYQLKKRWEEKLLECSYTNLGNTRNVVDRMYPRCPSNSNVCILGNIWMVLGQDSKGTNLDNYTYDSQVKLKETNVRKLLVCLGPPGLQQVNCSVTVWLPPCLPIVQCFWSSN